MSGKDTDRRLDRTGAGIDCAQAREAVRAALSGAETDPGWTEDVLTAVTELVSNARRHAGGVTAFRADVQAGGIVVAVSDGSRAVPRTAAWAPSEPGGFGWIVVNRLADTTDVQVNPDGKTITAGFTAPRAHV
ncbi:ATP-binding protein [Streptomyces subrutilus]|uniref:ATP-binding protein n=1 Tax=Streptomyces subrutilus TaxID=36818 RepID=UPI0033EE81B5